jgi:hypothetical protein
MDGPDKRLPVSGMGVTWKGTTRMGKIGRTVFETSSASGEAAWRH